MSNPTRPASNLDNAIDNGDADEDGRFPVGGQPEPPAFAVVHVDEGRHTLTWRGPERDEDGENVPGTDTTYEVDLDRFNLPKLITALITAHARRHPDGILHMLDALQAGAEYADYYETVGRLRTVLDYKARRYGTPPEKPVMPPQIRVSRYEHSIAVKWYDDENWYRFDPESVIHSEEGRRHRVGPTAFTDTPNDEWIDPFADPRPDIQRWTEPLRHQLRAALGMLDSAERHPWSG